MLGIGSHENSSLLRAVYGEFNRQPQFGNQNIPIYSLCSMQRKNRGGVPITPLWRRFQSPGVSDSFVSPPRKRDTQTLSRI